MWRRATTYLAIVLLVVGTFAPGRALRAGEPDPVACVLCAGARAVPCPTCSGKGQCLVRCDACDGKGHRECRVRVATREGERAKGWRHTVTTLRCPSAACHEGRVLWEGGAVSPCKLCGGTGQVRCQECLFAQSPCAVCAGRGKAQGPCADCSGTGKLACLVCRKAGQPCASCAGAGHLKCVQCDKDGTCIQPCETCGGRGVTTCDKCFGLGRKACSECAATGREKTVYVDGSAASSKHCDSCKGKGVSACSDCKSTGRTSCPRCAGAQEGRSACRTCGGGRKLPCSACSEMAYRTAEIEAGTLKTPATRDIALQLYTTARDGARAMETAAHADLAKLLPQDAVAAPPDGWDPADLPEPMKVLLDKLDYPSAKFEKACGAMWTFVEAHAIAARCEKALAALRPSAK